MRAAILKEFGRPLAIEEREIRRPNNSEVVVKVKASGLCVSDLHIQDGMIKSVKLPYVPGHEIAGEVWIPGDGVEEFIQGEPVIVGIDNICNNCRYCRSGRGNLCRNLVRTGFELDGGHAEYVTVKADQLFKIGGIPFQQACIIPDAVACMYHAVKMQGDVRAGDRAVILGTGGLGLQGVQILKLFGAEVFCTGRQDKKLEIAESLGADHCVNTTKSDLGSEIARLTGGEMCDVVFDNIGLQTSVQLSAELVRPGGKVVVVGYNDPSFSVNFQDIVVKEKEIVGIRGSTRGEIAEVLRFVESGKIRPFVSESFPLESINEALSKLRRGEIVGRSVIIP